ncbi:hypothetical protein BAY61_25135 [Prauserella marina]|uniref:Choline kinase n=2 Tax=Prauserella marina TaxID=530584 RepID=A0A222VUX9_9PSEU|nr:hypothetical protein BAY61_25135 [Prauserella marina]PWV75686.1 choline kinase [Prauserella marina]SDD28774.1 Choline kinase [Prauserella marina]
MGSLTSDRPKCLLEAGGRTLLDRQLAALRAGGIAEVAVVTGWHAEQFATVPLPRFHNASWARSSMVDSLACAWPWLTEGPVLACYGDIVFAPADVAAIAGESGPITVAYDPCWLGQWADRFVDPLADAETFRIGDDGRITEIGGQPASVSEVRGQYLGMVRFEPDGWAAIVDALAFADARGTRRDMTGLLGWLIGNGFPDVTGFAVTGPWHEFDHATDLDAGRHVLAELDSALFPA